MAFAENDYQNVETELKAVSKNTLIYSIGNIAVKSVTFLFIPLYTHYLDVKDVGVIVLLELLELFYYAFVPLGIFSAVWRYFNVEQTAGREKEFLSSSVLFVYLINLLFSVIMFYSAGWMASMYLDSNKLAGLFQVFVVTLFLGMSRTIIATFLRIYERAFRYTVFVFIDFTILILLAAYFVIKLDMGLWGIIYAKLITSAMIFLFFICYFVRNYGFHYEHKDVVRSFRFGLPLMFSSISLMVLSMSDRFIIKEIISIPASGIYGIAHKFGMIMNMIFVGPFTNAWHPIMYRLENKPEQGLTYQKIALYYLQIGILIWLVVNIVSKYAFFITTTEEYHPGIIIIPWIAFSYLVFGLQNIFKAGALIHNKTLSFTKYAVIAAVLNILLNITVIPILGIVGAAIATTSSYLVMMLLVLRLSQKHLPIAWLWRKMISVLVLGIICTAVSMGDLESLHLNLIKDIFIILLLPLLILVFRLVSIKEIRRFITMLREQSSG